MLRSRFLIFLLIFSLLVNINNIFSQQKELKTKSSFAPKSEDISKTNLQDLKKTRDKKVFALSVALLIILLFLCFFFYQNNKLRRKIRLKNIKQGILLNVINSGIDSQEIERKKIASFLHDNINSLLSSAGLHLNTFTTLNNIKSEEIEKTKAILQQAHDLLRDMSHDLIPALLIRFGLAYALEDLCERTSNSTILFEFYNSVPSDKRYVEKFEMKVYFIITELFNNIIKHSGAKKTQIRLKEKYNKLIIVLQDDGIGFNSKKTSELEGFGLNRIKARIKKFKGSFEIISELNEGTTVKIKIPIPH